MRVPRGYMRVCGGVVRAQTIQDRSKQAAPPLMCDRRLLASRLEAITRGKDAWNDIHALICELRGDQTIKAPVRVCWVGATSEEDACKAVAYACRVIATDEDDAVECDDGEDVYEVELRARKVADGRAGKDGT